MDYKAYKNMNPYEIILQMIRKYHAEDSVETARPFVGEHDRIYAALSLDFVPIDSEYGKILDEAGWFEEDDSWCHYT